jgi:hypothetical protein
MKPHPQRMHPCRGKAIAGVMVMDGADIERQDTWGEGCLGYCHMWRDMFDTIS